MLVEVQKCRSGNRSDIDKLNRSLLGSRNSSHPWPKWPKQLNKHDSRTRIAKHKEPAAAHGGHNAETVNSAVRAAADSYRRLSHQRRPPDRPSGLDQHSWLRDKYGLQIWKPHAPSHTHTTNERTNDTEGTIDHPRSHYREWGFLGNFKRVGGSKSLHRRWKFWCKRVFLLRLRWASGSSTTKFYLPWFLYIDWIYVVFSREIGQFSGRIWRSFKRC